MATTHWENFPLLDGEQPTAQLLRVRAPALPSAGPTKVVRWLDCAGGDGGTLCVQESTGPLSSRLDLRVVIIDGRTVALWLTPDGHRLGWLLGASA